MFLLLPVFRAEEGAGSFGCEQTPFVARSGKSLVSGPLPVYSRAPHAGGQARNPCFQKHELVLYTLESFMIHIFTWPLELQQVMQERKKLTQNPRAGQPVFPSNCKFHS